MNTSPALPHLSAVTWSDEKLNEDGESPWSGANNNWDSLSHWMFGLVTGELLSLTIFKLFKLTLL